MAPRVLLSRLAQKVRPFATEIVRRATGSCSGPRPDPPCECTAPPALPCRTVVSRPAPVLRVLCRPPPSARPPPCPPCEPAAQLTCSNAITGESLQEVHSKRASHLVSKSSATQHLKGKRDRVACRLAHAERTRQLNYEEEVALEPPLRPLSAPPAHYRLGDNAHLAPDDGCRIRRVPHSDPCAHRPSILQEIQRSPAEQLSAPAPASAPASSPDSSTHHGRCDRTVEPAAGPPRCRPPSIVERLRGLSRPAGSNRPGDRRGLHAKAGGGVPVEPVARQDDGLMEALRSRERLREAGRGRVACTSNASESARTRAAGTLELGVPAGARILRVRVILENGGEIQADAPVRKGQSSPGNTPDSWLSMKNIQNKLSGRRRETCGLVEQKKCPQPNPCTGRLADANSAGGAAGAGGAGGAAGAGAGRCGATALLSAAPVPSR